ncbi:Outer membrane protein A [bacterium HR21]|nr:Outer membrane protein A [bacterium HR21]
MGVWILGLLVGGIVSLCGQPARQPIARLGIAAGYGANLYTAQFRQLPGVPNCCPGFDGGRGTGIAVNLLGEYPWLPYAWFSGQLGYWTLSGDLWKQERIGNVALLGAQGDTVIRAAEVGHTLRASLSVGILDAGISSRFFGHFMTRLGVALGVLLRRDFHQYEQLIAPEGFVFAAEGSRRRNEYRGPIPEAPRGLVGASFSVGYVLPVGGTWELVPMLHYVTFLNNLSSVSWKPSALRFGVSLLYTLYPPPAPLRDTIYRRDTVVVSVLGLPREELVLQSRREWVDTLQVDGLPWYRTTIVEVWHHRLPRQPVLVSELALQLPDTASALVLEELEQEEAFPLLPYVFFPEGSAQLEQTRMELLTTSEADQFEEKRLPMNTLQVYYHLLNIVGKRLRQFPTAELTVTGCVSNVGVELNNHELARRRAEAVREYLVKVWNIEPRRIHVRARLLPAVPSNPQVPEGQEENRRVELSATLPEILAPVFLSEVSYVATPSAVVARATVRAETTVVRWRLQLSHDGIPVLSREGTGNPPASMLLEVPSEKLARGDSLLRAELFLRDALGTEQTAEAVLPFRRLSLRQKRAERVGSERRERFALTLFEYDKATLTPEHQRLLALIRQRSTASTRIVISGYTDRTGDPVYNKQLAERRCRNVWQALRLQGTPEIRAIGSDVLLYPNELPEGRAYSRTVIVELFVPVE